MEVERDRGGGDHGTLDVEEESGKPCGHAAIVVRRVGDEASAERDVVLTSSADAGRERSVTYAWSVSASREDLEALYRERYLGFRRALASVTGSYEVAHDVVQEAFARALSQPQKYRGDGPLGAWVWGIAVRVAREERKRRVGVPLAEIETELIEPAHDPVLSEALAALPPRRRMIFVFRYLGDMSYREIAAVCEISEGTVAASLAQARASIAEALESGDLAEAVRR
jgi:RNA polymerase sigma-70 factor (ECF subfamily)